uniref:RING-type domain-containing protein n=1 Tax=Alexandrium monilatum TaxID=311494 RepID=A0A6T1BC94_9DINO
MASVDGEAEDVPPEFECTICMKLMLDPVTVSCGHTFCRVCLEQSLGYRGLCAVCRSPVAAGQGVNILVRGIIADRFPRALAQRREELQQEMLAGEREADENRRREARGGSAGTGNEGAGAVLPLLRLEGQQAQLLPHSSTELELLTAVEQQLVEYTLQGSRRLGVIDGSSAYDDDARPLGVCLEIQNVERPHRQQPQQQQVVRVQLMGKYRFWLTEAPEMHERGFELGRAEAFFDEPLPAADLALSRGGAPSPPEGAAGPDSDGVQELPTTPEVALAALELLERQLVHVGQSGRHMFIAKFGEVPAVRSDGAAGATTSASMERLSFWLLGALVMDPAERKQWIACVDTRARLECCREKLEAAGSRPVLDLPGARSWMNPGQSALGSFALLLAIIVLFVAKALGLFEKGARRRTGSGSLEDAFAFGQLLR